MTSGLIGFDDAEEMTAERFDALDQLHRKMTHDIANAHLTGNNSRAQQVADYRRTLSERLPGDDQLVEPLPLDRDDREDFEDERATLTRELHDAVARKDTYHAGKLDRARNDLTEELYGNGDIVGAGGRSL